MNLWRERFGALLRPFARRCPFSPNSITVAAIILALIGATAFALGGHYPILFLIGIGIVALAGLLDAFDGAVARAQGRTSRFGDFLDHFSDRVCDSAIVTGWLIGSNVRPSIGLLTLFAVMILGYTGTQVEASFGARSYSGVGRAEFVVAMCILPLMSYWLAGRAPIVAGGLQPADWAALLVAAVALIGTIQRVTAASREFALKE